MYAAPDELIHSLWFSIHININISEPKPATAVVADGTLT